MVTSISKKTEELIDEILKHCDFPTRTAVVDAAVKILAERIRIEERLAEGLRQLENGDFTEYDDESLKEYFDDVIARGQKRYAERKRNS